MYMLNKKAIKVMNLSTRFTCELCGGVLYGRKQWRAWRRTRADL